MNALENPNAGGLGPGAAGRLPPSTPPAEAPPPGTGRFPRSARLLKHAAFEQVYQQGGRIFSGHLTAFFLRRAEAEGPRVGFTVSRALGGAVDRNRIKRRLRAAVRQRLTRLQAPVDVVINPKRSVLHLEFDQLLTEIERAFAGVEQRLSGGGRQVRPGRTGSRRAERR